jgi:hypothetical protein
MADNVGYTPGSGATVAADDIGGVLHQRVKIGVGADGSATDVSEANPMPVLPLGELVEALQALRMTAHSLQRSIGMIYPDVSGRPRVVLDVVTSGVTIPIVTTVNTVSTVTNQSQVGGFIAAPQVPALMGLVSDSLRRNVSVS